MVKYLSELFPEYTASDPEISGITSSSREVKPGALYFAIRGTKVDGHEFIPEAIKNGAAAVVVEQHGFEDLSVPLVKVRSTRLALAETASAWFGHPSREMGIVGITGTNGKTTTSYLLRHLWTKLKMKSGLLGTVEYWIGDRCEKSSLTTPDPLTLQRLLAEMREEFISVAVMEVSSIALDQYRAHGTSFRVGIFTNLTQDHLDYHGSMEKYFETKARFFRDIDLQTSIVNVDDPYGKKLVEGGVKGRAITFALENGAAEFVPLSYRLSIKGTDAEVHTPEGKRTLKTPLIGKHNLANCLAAAAAGYALGYPIDDVFAAFRDAVGAPGRLERVKVSKGGPNVFVDYAHTPDALANVLSALNSIRMAKSGRLITVFGCGGDRDKTKRSEMGRIVSAHSEITIATSDNPRTESPGLILDAIEQGVEKTKTEYYREENRRSAIHLALKLSKPDDIVLIAGKGHETYQIVGKKEFPFDDRAVVRDYFT